MKINLWRGGSLVQQTLTGGSGLYSFDTYSFATYSIRIDTQGIPFNVYCPSNGTLTSAINVQDSFDSNKDFALRCRPGFDLKAHSIAGHRFRPANLTLVNIGAGDASNFYGAHCAAGTSGAVIITFSGSVTYVSPAGGALTPSVSGNTLTYNIADFGNVNFFTAFNFIVRIDTNAALGSQVCFTVSVTPTAGDNNPANNTLAHCFTVVGSFDPNDKQVDPIGAIDTSEHWLTYTVNFQNTGTDTAIHIYITDTLDTDLDESTFQLLAYSHAPMVQITGNAVRFNFPNINLPDSNVNEPASHGYVQYKVKLNDNLPIGTQIDNTAFIYFDFNAPVVTNTVTNSIVCQFDTTAITDTICEGETYDFYGVQLNSSGVYTEVLTDVNGCDSVLELHLAVIPTAHTDLAASICDGELYVFEGDTLYGSGIYESTHTASNGCDSVVALTLTVFPTYFTTVPVTICTGQSFSFGGLVLDSTGIYLDTLTNAFGCDSIIQLSLFVTPHYTTNLNISICNGESFLFAGVSLTAPGLYFDTLSTATGCDSVIYLMLTVLPNSASGMSASICQGETYSFNGQGLSAGGVYRDTLTSANGCDSVVTLTLTVLPVSFTGLTANICEGDTFVFAGQALTMSGVYNDTLTNSYGCDSIVQLTLAVHATAVTNLSGTICDDETYQFAGQVLSTSGVYIDMLTGSYGCDSVVVLTLTVLAPSFTGIGAGVCENSVYNFNGTLLTDAGLYFDTLTTVNGCDSIVALTLYSFSSSYTSLTQSACEGDTIYFGGSALTQSGLYTDTLQNGQGCDSVVQLVLSVLPESSTAIDTAILQGEFYLLASGDSVSVAGAYINTYVGANGCDSVVVINLSVILSVEETESPIPDVRLYPNPASDAVTISIDERMIGSTVTVTDITGRKIAEQLLTTRHSPLATHYFANGVYFVKVTSEEGISATKKLIISR